MARCSRLAAQRTQDAAAHVCSPWRREANPAQCTMRHGIHSALLMDLMQLQQESLILTGRAGTASCH